MLAGARVLLARETAMSNRYARALAAGGAAVTVAALGVPAALAAGTWTVRPGGAISLSLTSGRFTVKDTPTGAMIRCAFASFSGALKNGGGHSGTGIGSITTGSSRDCGSLGMFTLTPGDLPWHLNLTSYNAAEGVVRGTIGHIQIRLGGSMGCDAVIDGTSATADNGRVALRYSDGPVGSRCWPLAATLHFHDVSVGRVGVVGSGDSATLSVAFAVSPKQVITSP
jgi:hypothetical protein